MRDWQRDFEISQAATPGPWGYDFDFPTEPINGYIYKKENGKCTGPAIAKVYHAAKECYNNLLFITESREALPYWLQRFRELEAQVRELEAARDTLLSELEWAKRNRDKRIKELEAKCSVAKEALEKLRDLLPEFGGLDGRVWRIIDETLAALGGEGGGQDVC